MDCQVTLHLCAAELIFIVMNVFSIINSTETILFYIKYYVL